jgi:hypothetical protein
MASETLFASETQLQNELTFFNRSRLCPTAFSEDWQSRLEREMGFRIREGEMVDQARMEVEPLLADLPSDPALFLAWFEKLRDLGPGQHDPHFPWLAEEANYAEMRWFIEQEVAGEAGFDDLVAYTQIRMPTRAKLELARNYWDEMGRGNEKAMHGPMLKQLANELDIDSDDADIVPEAKALSNLMIALATNRYFAYQSIGCLGVVELTAPDRARQVADGLKRLGISPVAQRYYILHSTLDVHHWRAWSAEVIDPMVRANPEVMRPIAEGALLRLSAGAKCFKRYRRHLWRGRDFP